MKQRLCLLTVVFWCLTTLLHAQERSAKSEKQKSMTFQPGSKVPDEVAATAVKPTSAVLVASAAAALPNPNDLPGQVIAVFFGLLQKNELDQAYESLTKNSKIGERPEEVKALKTKTKEAIEVFGPVQGFELAESKTVGSRLLRRTYLSLNRDFPLRWRFYFYLSDNVSRLIDLRVDDRVGGMFDEPEDAGPSETKP